MFLNQDMPTEGGGEGGGRGGGVIRNEGLAQQSNRFSHHPRTRVQTPECAVLETMSNPLPQLNEAAAAGGVRAPSVRPLRRPNNRQTDGQRLFF